MSGEAGRDRYYTKEDLDNGVPIPAPLLPLVPAIKEGRIKGAKFDNRPRREEIDDLKKELEKAKEEIKKLKKEIRRGSNKFAANRRS